MNAAPSPASAPPAPRLSFAAGCLLLAAASLVGCASPVWHPRVESVSGDYKNTAALSAKAENTAEGEASDVKAMVTELPPGITIHDGVLTADSSMYEVLGKVSAKPASDFFYPYRESWRRPFCHPQRVLTVATLYLWMLVPTSWPCFISGGSVEDRRDAIVEAMKRATKAMGGNLVLVSGFGGMTTVTVTSGTTAQVSSVEATEGVGWAIRVVGTPKAPEPAAPAGAQSTSL